MPRLWREWLCCLKHSPKRTCGQPKSTPGASIDSEKNDKMRSDPEDAPALGELSRDPEVYRTLPIFLFEQKYEDPAEVISRLEEECVKTRESLLLAVAFKEAPKRLIGLAEIYHWREERKKASIGCRLGKAYWGRGIATETIGLLKEYLLEAGIVRITAHILTDNIGSCRAVEKMASMRAGPNRRTGDLKSPSRHIHIIKKAAAGGHRMRIAGRPCIRPHRVV